MRLFRGYKGRYFSLAAILACSAGVSLEANAVSVEAKGYEVAQNFASEKESETDAVVTLDTIHIIESKKSYERTSSKTLQQISHTIDSVEIITSEEIELKGFQNVREVLDSIAGVSSTANGAYGQSSSLYLRGLDAKHTLVLVDGVRLNDPSGLSGAQIELVDLYNIDRIELVKGAQSGVWGSDAVAGVVNIITKKKQNGARVMSEFGSHGWQKYAASAGVAKDAFDISFAFAYTDTKGISAAAPKKGSNGYGDKNLDWEKDGFTNRLFEIKGGADITKDDRLEFTIRDSRADIHFDADAGMDADDYDDVWGYGVSEYFNTIKSSLYSLGYVGLHNGHAIDIKTNYSRFERSFYDGYLGKTYEVQIKDEMRYLESDSLVLGAGYMRDEVDRAAGALLVRGAQDDKHIFAVNSNKLGDFLVTQSLRFDARDTFDDKLTGKIGFKYNFYRDFYLASSYKTGFTAPNLYQQSYGATSELQAETSQGYEITAGGDMFSLTYFDQRIKNAIEYGGAYPLDYYYNIDGKSRYKGFEISANAPLSPALFGELSYSYLDAKNANGERIARRARNRLNASLLWTISDALFVNLKGSYIGSRYDSVGANAVQTGRYFLADLSLNYDINDKLSFYFKANNIFDKYYQEVDGYGSLGRVFYVGARGSF
ncbi:MAG: TonB-dependent receptor [Campylobacteraceae bacterium]|jgi:vitamin B12 transporter|nr:TonB-dependent receptor [Campylobacteraceae bacterium]